MPHDRATFNLVDEPWIPVLDLAGREQYVSLATALLQAHQFRDLTGELPTMRFALLRILLSVCYRVLDAKPVEETEERWGELWRQTELPAEGFNEYLAAWRHRFDLFEAEAPFLQVPGMHTAKGEWKPPALIVADVDTDQALFTMRSELDSLEPAEAARWLVHANAYDFSGIKSGAVGDPRVKGGKGYPLGIGWAGWLGGTALTGSTLRETLLLNLVLGRETRSAQDLPIWEQAPLPAGPRPAEALGALGPISLMSWPQRRFRLNHEQGRITGVLVGNGDELDYTTQWQNELMSGWRFSEPQSSKAKAVRYMPRKLETGRALWRGLTTLLPSPTTAKMESKAWRGADVSQPAAVVAWLGRLVATRQLAAESLVEVRVVSMAYGTQNASYEEVAHDRLEFAAAFAQLSDDAGLRAAAVTAVERAEQAIRALGDLARDVHRAGGGEGEGASQHAQAEAFTAADPAFRRWLLTVVPGGELEAMLLQWTETVRNLIRGRAERIILTAPQGAWSGRMHKSTGSGPNSTVVSVPNALQWFESRLFRALGGSPAAAAKEPGSAQGNTEERTRL